MLRTFILQRDKDHSGVSGIGKVAEGVLFVETGEAIVHWFGCNASINIYHDINAVLAVHGHNGSTHILFDDNKPPPIIDEKKTN